MKGTYSALMQSKFFNPAFNSAIFDGPVRIYFAQSQEALALKIYFHLQQRHAEEISRAKELHKFLERTVLVLLYPTTESFQLSFDGGNDVTSDQLMEDSLIGVPGPVDDEKLDQVLEQILKAFQEWEKIPFEKLEANAML